MTRILFTGYAPVHFVCFRPLYEALSADPSNEVLVSGGTRHVDEAGNRQHDTADMYASFDLPPESVVDYDELPDLDVDVLVSACTKPIKPRSYAETVQIFHGLSFRNRAIRSQNTHYDNYLMLGPYMVRTFERRGLFAKGDPRVSEIGFPKTDRLLNGTLDRASVLRELGFSGDRPVVMFAPTGAHGNAMEVHGEELVKYFTETQEYDLLVKPHDHPKADVDWFDRLAPLESEHTRLLREFDSIPSLFATDVLISDASSIANEYLLLDRPLVFLDVPALLESAAGEDDRLDLDTWGRKGGTVAHDVAEAERAVASALADPDRLSSVRKSITQDLFFNPGSATEAAVAWFRDQARLSA
jgi:CDP-glycerol glycerophosphotransferase (TagB/SpsB family)